MKFLKNQLAFGNLFIIKRSLYNLSNVGRKVTIYGKTYETDENTNITPKIIPLLDRKLHHQKYHPLNHLKKRIVDFFYSNWLNSRGNPIFSVHDSLEPVVTIEQNFDSLLVAKDHVSRSKTDNFYINKNYMLRAHTSAHQADLIKMGLDNFLVIGDVYRRDTIDATHYQAFHQTEGVRLLSKIEIAKHLPKFSEISIFNSYGQRTEFSQGIHNPEVLEYISIELKRCLEKLAMKIFGKDIEYRWVDAYFPFTCPSWELEVKFADEWMEVLGCGIIEQEILVNSGVEDKVGWAFGLGLERWAMKLYGIPDIRNFWSQDAGFLSQFKFEDPSAVVKFKPVSKHPALYNDISFWLPQESYHPNDFYDLVRHIGGDLIQQVELIDEYKHPKNKTSHTYRITYRSLERVLSNADVSKIREELRQNSAKLLNVNLR